MPIATFTGLFLLEGILAWRFSAQSRLRGDSHDLSHRAQVKGHFTDAFASLIANVAIALCVEPFSMQAIVMLVDISAIIIMELTKSCDNPYKEPLTHVLSSLKGLFLI